MLWWCTANHMSNKSTFLLYASSSVGWEEGWWPTNLCSNFYSPEPNRDATRTADDRVRASADNVPAWRLDSWAPPTYVWDHIASPHSPWLQPKYSLLAAFVFRTFCRPRIYLWFKLLVPANLAFFSRPSREAQMNHRHTFRTQIMLTL